MIKLSKKSGVTMTMLIIYLVVATVLMGVAISTYLNNQSVKQTDENVFKATIQDYIEEFNVSKEYYKMNFEWNDNLTLKNEEIVNNKKITDYIPSLSIADKEFICINNGNIAFYGLTSSDVRYDYLTSLGLTCVTY